MKLCSIECSELVRGKSCRICLVTEDDDREKENLFAVAARRELITSVKRTLFLNHTVY